MLHYQRHEREHSNQVGAELWPVYPAWLCIWWNRIVTLLHIPVAYIIVDEVQYVLQRYLLTSVLW